MSRDCVEGIGHCSVNLSIFREHTTTENIPHYCEGSERGKTNLFYLFFANFLGRSEEKWMAPSIGGKFELK